MVPPATHGGFEPVAQCHPEKARLARCFRKQMTANTLGHVLRGADGRREKNYITIKKFIPLFAV